MPSNKCKLQHYNMQHREGKMVIRIPFASLPIPTQCRCSLCFCCCCCRSGAVPQRRFPRQSQPWWHRLWRAQQQQIYTLARQGRRELHSTQAPSCQTAAASNANMPSRVTKSQTMHDQAYMREPKAAKSDCNFHAPTEDIGGKVEFINSHDGSAPSWARDRPSLMLAPESTHSTQSLVLN